MNNSQSDNPAYKYLVSVTMLGMDMAQERTAALELCEQARAEREIMSIVDHRPRWDGEGTWVK